MLLLLEILPHYSLYFMMRDREYIALSSEQFTSQRKKHNLLSVQIIV
jgi:hypothetical protein